MAHTAHAVPVSLALTIHKCYSCGINSDDAHTMSDCPSCHEFLCDSNCACDGRCRCELTLRFRAINSENVAQFGLTPICFIKDESGRYVAVCAECSKIMDAQIGYTDFDLFDHQTARRIRAIDMEVLDTGRTVERINEIVTRQGTHQYWLVEKSRMVAEGKRFVNAVAYDVTCLVRGAGVMA